MHNGGDSLSVGMRWLWSGAESSRLGRPAELDTGQIVNAAIAIADSDGVTAVTMGRVAKALGFTPMSLYRYVGSKDELLELMVDVVSGDPPDCSRYGDDWRRALEVWTWSLLRIYQAREWVVEVPISGPPAGPNSLAWLDAGLGAFPAEGLSGDERIQIVLLLSGYVRNEVRVSLEVRRGRRRSGKSMQTIEVDYWRTVGSLVTPERFPALGAMLATEEFTEQAAIGAGDSDTSDAAFAFGLECILDGVEGLLHRQARHKV